MANKFINSPISGEEKSKYLFLLDAALESLAENLKRGMNEEQKMALKIFAGANKWDMTRLPSGISPYRNLAEIVSLVRNEYQWFNTLYFDEPTKNRGYFDEITISAATGLPWSFDFMKLQGLKKDAQAKLQQADDYKKISDRLKLLLLQDTMSVDQVKNTAYKSHEAALKRSFLEQLASAELLMGAEQQIRITDVKKIVSLGGEDLWNLAFLKYSLADGVFHAYVADMWQDIREPQITKNDANSPIVISESLLGILASFMENNSAEYLLGKIDESFESLHPVHLSKALIGPFENKYTTRPNYPLLPLTPKLISDNPETAILRFSRQYTFAPNHFETGNGLRQRRHTERWSDEIIVCPSGLSSAIANSILGTDVRIFEYNPNTADKNCNEDAAERKGR